MRVRLADALVASVLVAAVVGGTVFAQVAKHAPALEQAKAVLNPASKSGVHGRALLSLNPKTQVLVVTVTARGLKPNSSHPEHIHKGTCAHYGAIVYGLKNLIANKKGIGRSVTSVRGVKVIPAKGWIVNIHLGPSLVGKGLTQIACGPVVGGKGGSSSKSHSTWG